MKLSFKSKVVEEPTVPEYFVSYMSTILKESVSENRVKLCISLLNGNRAAFDI